MDEILISKVELLNEIKDIIFEFDRTFTPSLKSRVLNLNKYSEKLYNNAITLKAIYNGDIVGFASFYCNDRINFISYLTQISVKDTARNKGIGQLLLKKVIEFCHDNNMKFLRLEVYNENIPAIKLYEKNEFYKIGNATNDSCYMERKL